MKRLTLLLMFLSVLVGCDRINGYNLRNEGASSEDESSEDGSQIQFDHVALNTNEVVNIRREMESIEIMEARSSVPQFHPQNLLHRIHPWLRQHAGLRQEVTRLGEFNIIRMNKIPDRTLNEILRRTFPNNIHSGFLVLQASFWRQIAALQSRNIQISFIVPQGNTTVGGFFRPDAHIPTLAFDMLANEGTLDHEFRHFQQHQASTQLWYDPRFISASCRRAAERAFNEIDATTQQLSSWIPVIEQYEILQPQYRQVRLRPDSVSLMVEARLPILRFLANNLEYPAEALGWVFDAGVQCPDELRNVLSGLIHDVYHPSSARVAELRAEAFRLRIEAISAWAVENNPCTPANARNRDECGDIEDATPHSQVVASLQAREEELKHQLIEAVRAQIQARNSVVKERLRQLPSDVLFEMCRGIPSFANVANCPRYN